MTSKEEKSAQNTTVWIHCNKCFENYKDKQRSIYILSCYDVVCEKCIKRVSQSGGKCPICGKTVKGRPIGNDLSSNLKELFHPKPWTLSFQKAWQIVKFQTKQRDRFSAGCRKLAEYNKSLETERDRIKEECKQTYLLHIKVRKERVQLEAALKKFMERYAYQCKEKSRHSEVHYEQQRGAFHKPQDDVIPPTYHAQRNEHTFDFSPENDMSKTFYL